MKKSLLSSFALCLVLGSSLVAACGGGDSSSSSSSKCSGPSGMTLSGECQTCVDAHCSSQYSSFCSNSCGTNSSSSACQKAASDIGTCALSNCSSQCVSASGGGADSGTVTTNTGGANDGTVTTPTTGGANDGTTPPTGTGTGTVVLYCNMTTDGLCSKSTTLKQVKPTADQDCIDNGGTPVDACPTKDLIGCCALGGGIAEVCVYPVGKDAVTEATCATEMGKWSATP